MEIKASGEENGVVATGRPCHPELKDLLGILQVHGVQGPWQGGEDRGQQILVRHMLLTLPCCCELSGMQGGSFRNYQESLSHLKCGQVWRSVLQETALPDWGKGCSNLGASFWKVLP